MATTVINQTPNPDSSKPKTPIQPPPPTMFTGKQGFFLILVLTAAVVGWVLYINKWQQAPATPPNEESATMQEETAELKEYTAIPKTYVGEAIALPTPVKIGRVSVEEALAGRRSKREFTNIPLSTTQLSQMLWAAQGITDEETLGRTAPSARSIYPYNLYVVVRNVANMQPGLYHFLPEEQAVRPLIFSESLLKGEADQPSVSSAPAVLVYGAIFDKTREQFEGDSAIQVTLQESGHIAQNVYLQAVGIGLGTVVVGGFDAQALQTELRLPADETVVYLQPFGNPAEETQE